MKEINILSLYNEVEKELSGQRVEYCSDVGMCKEIERLHKNGSINLWNMDEQDIKLTMKRILMESQP